MAFLFPNSVRTIFTLTPAIAASFDAPKNKERENQNERSGQLDK
jgi:hypothetical protein